MGSKILRNSLGRIMATITFLLLLVYWTFPLFNREITPPESLTTVFQTLLLYEVIKKGKYVLETKLGGMAHAHVDTEHKA